MRKLGAGLGALALAATVLTACGSDDGGSDGKTVLNVFAAASLKSSFAQLEQFYEKAHPDVDVKVVTAGSSALVTQIEQGADADVIATADEETMAKLGDRAVNPQIFASNTLVIVTAPGNPKRINTFADLKRGDVTTVVCAVTVPCGAATAEVEHNTGIDISPVSEEASVTAVLTKVTSGQADAGLVYVTDARGAGGKVTTVVDPAFAKVVNKYPIATIKGSAHGEDAAMFVGLVLGQTGEEVLSTAGFGTP
ncbi:molybdate ABC transporter substrate-binding protein [Gordonia sp. ABSL1-1]|uniref:molybdate ABC transporter substrate-binding protein n=1 Tax=Gordonia sp. ABSL1-1 TaxID=3053923 RepID=UPI0025747786|nr:molybdate ABC transporter substrate-binding protein [Gordonia sp. ABSL1-1]MDL9935180.1 molybdate ABC transporter substrate-binding protein [Gordonia sp. ABSL1-1]